MWTRQVRRVASYLLIALASICLFLGGREFLGSRLGQMESAREFEVENQAPAQTTSEPTTNSPELRSPLAGETIGKLSIPRLKAEIYVVRILVEVSE